MVALRRLQQLSAGLQDAAAASSAPLGRPTFPLKARLVQPANPVHSAGSVVAAVGAAVGGIAASRLGVSACFVIDGITYLLAAYCAKLLEVGAS